MGERAQNVRRLMRRLVTIVVLAVVLLPAVSGDDSFPMSSYPMYAFSRSRTERFYTVLGEAPTGELTPLPIRVVADTDDPLIAAAVVRIAINDGSSLRLCRQISTRVGDGIDRLLVVEEVHDVIRRAMSGAATPEERVVHATCEVPE
jgi:hypothetical protein